MMAEDLVGYILVFLVLIRKGRSREDVLPPPLVRGTGLLHIYLSVN